MCQVRRLFVTCRVCHVNTAVGRWSNMHHPCHRATRPHGHTTHMYHTRILPVLRHYVINVHRLRRLWCVQRMTQPANSYSSNPQHSCPPSSTSLPTTTTLLSLSPSLPHFHTHFYTLSIDISSYFRCRPRPAPSARRATPSPRQWTRTCATARWRRRSSRRGLSRTASGAPW